VRDDSLDELDVALKEGGLRPRVIGPQSLDESRLIAAEGERENDSFGRPSRFLAHMGWPG
jgi:hypothetical protein